MENNNQDQFVYHGSPVLFETVVPKRNIRSRMTDGVRNVLFDQISFHATPHKYIALAYTLSSKRYDLGGRCVRYNMGVSLYEDKKIIDIDGFESLQKSLEALYGSGGYLLTFKKEDFFHTEGLGPLEVITKDSIRPFAIEKIEDPAGEMRRLGVTFHFNDLSLPENEAMREYCDYKFN